jgi:LAO/AO transport system kinase
LNNSRLSLSEFEHGILKADRMVLAKAITLVESSRADDIALATALMDKISVSAGNSIRIGVTGVPGVGKSTFIEAFGELIIREGKKIAVLTVDPSSQLTKGSILGDKTRMENLSKNPNAFIRPSSSGSVLGGVTGKTREAILLCEAAGFNVIIVETVGVGQSEVAVRNMVDFFLLLMLAGAGDELQGIKKGIMEMADAVVITKADGDNTKRAREAQAEYQHALHLFPVKVSGWNPPVMISSAYEKSGIHEIWNKILQYEAKIKSTGFFDHQRQQQNQVWFLDYFQQLLNADFQNNETLKKITESLSKLVGTSELSAFKAAHDLMKAYHQQIKDR